MTEDEKPHINAGYPIGQLLKALKSTGAQAQKHIEQWQQVLTGVLDRSLQIGSCAPLKDTPVWVTLEVVHGGAQKWWQRQHEKIACSYEHRWCQSMLLIVVA